MFSFGISLFALPLAVAGQDLFEGSDGACVYSSSCPFTGVNAPVFIQVIDDGSEATFPSRSCLPCRGDHRSRCLSAQVTCPSEPGKPIEERIWEKSESCEGLPTRVSYLGPDSARCPGPEHYSPDNLNLERFVAKLLRDHGHLVPDESTARAAVEEYRRMLHLVQLYPESPVVPSKLVDLVWHEHILDTATYRRDTLRMFGRYVDHNPSFGGEEEKEELRKQQRDMFALYRSTFENAPPIEVWPTASKAEVGKVPDCCSAFCVKPACASCVGCNAIDCGYLGTEGGAAAKRRAILSPDAFAGYVPASDGATISDRALLSTRKAAPSLRAAKDPTPEYPYKCAVEPLDGLKLEWAICDDRIHFKQTLQGKNAWYAVGLAPNQGMAYGDFMVSMMNKNYTNIFDLYKFDDGNGYPCFDVLFQCSEGANSQGTLDLEDRQISRSGTTTTSSWSRKLVTDDFKDYPITPKQMNVLFAHGSDDWFTYHSSSTEVCDLNFFTGDASSC